LPASQFLARLAIQLPHEEQAGDRPHQAADDDGGLNASEKPHAIFA
jgi:hypothetical protein